MTNKSQGVYATHRENQRGRILQVAQDLFIEKGIELITITDIARAAHLARATIYQYFASKQEVAWAIFEILLAQWRQVLEQEVWLLTGNGYEKLSRFLISSLDLTIHQPKESSFLAQFSYLYAKEGSPERMAKTIQQGLGRNDQFMAEIIRQGIADGSLRPDLDADLAVTAIFNLSAAMQLRLGLLGTKVEAESGQSIPGIFHEICRIFLDGIKATPT